MRQSRPIARTTVVIVVSVLALLPAACSKSGDDAATPVTAPPTTAAPPTYPLTGKPITDQATATQAAVSVKIDNNAAARPQAGIDKADVVYEEFTEGITRFIVVFQSTNADPVGPVRSIRPADPTIIAPLGGVFAFSGGSDAILAIAPESGATIVTENATDVMKRRAGRRAPHNLYASTAGLASKAPAGTPPPKFSEFLRAGQPFAGAGIVPVAHINLKAAPGVVADYDWDPGTGTWKRSTDGGPHKLEDGTQIAPVNVIVQFTPYLQFEKDSKVKYPNVLGTGDVLVFAAGQVIKGTWSKAAKGDVTAFKDPSGAPIVLPPGQTWVHLSAPDAPPTLT